MVMFAPGALDRDPRLGHALRRVRARWALRVLFRGLAILAVGLILGVAEILSVGYLTSSYRDAFAFGVMILILIFKPSGLFGSLIHED